MRSSHAKGPPLERHDHVRRRGNAAHAAALLLLTLLLLLLAAAAAAADHANRRALHQEAAGGAETSPCHPDCTSNGNCNLEDTRCECPFGYTGPSCQESQLPACQVSVGDMPFFGTFQPKNCECYKQAASFFGCTPGKLSTCQHELYKFRLPTARCYTFSGRPASEQWSAVPELGAAGVHWFRMDSSLKLTPTAEAQARKAINLWGYDKCVALPLTSCPGNCSGHGVCIDSCFPEDPKRSPWCECHKGFSGHECQEVDTSLCLNNCNDHGKCIRGFCHCKSPFFGLDCSRSQHIAARPDVLPDRSRPVVYMYELPHSLSTRLPLDDNVHDEVSIYSSYLQFLSIFLRDWATRTEDPWAANLFYIPAFTYSYTSNGGDPSPYVQRVLQHIRTSYPFFNRTSGKDHFMWLVGDTGACDLSLEASNIIKISHFGYHADVRIQGPSQMGRNAVDPVHGCFNPARDIVAAPYNDLGLADAQNMYAEIVASKGAAPQREKLFFFAGGVRPENAHYSGGVRQAIAEMLKQTFKVDKLDGQYDDVVFIHGSTDNYRELYNTTKFCLAPHGSGFGIRLSIAMVHGCIPVIIQDHVYQPFESLVSYDEISVRIAKSEIPDLLPILRGISEEEQSSMRLKMAQYYKAFIWEQSYGGEAYNYTIEALFKRVHAMWGELY